MFDLEKMTQMAKDVGFTGAAGLKREDMRFMDEVRDMCAANKCHLYDKCWTCPPACGSIEECAERANAYTHGIVVQSTAELEDSFDIEGMQELEQVHKERFFAMRDLLRQEYPNLMPLGSGGCTVCPTCAYPDKPCRFPDKAISSMEAYGLLVSDVCQRCNLPYYYGPNTLTYTACYLVE